MPCVLNHKRDGLPRGAVYVGRQVRRSTPIRSKWQGAGGPFGGEGRGQCWRRPS